MDAHAAVSVTDLPARNGEIVILYQGGIVLAFFHEKGAGRIGQEVVGEHGFFFIQGGGIAVQESEGRKSNIGKPEAGAVDQAGAPLPMQRLAGGG